MKLLILDAAENTTEAFVNLLAERRIAALSERFTDRAQLSEALRTHDWDILLLNEEVEDSEAADYVASARQAGMNTSVFMLTSAAPGIDALTRAYRNGIAGLLSMDCPDYSIISVEREFSAICQRRREQELQQDNHELLERCRLLLDSSREAIAYVHDGMHVYANASYLRMFGCQDLEELLCTPFLDMVAADCRDTLKSRLTVTAAKSARKPDEEPDDSGISMVAVDAKGLVFNARMILQPTRYEGEQCMQVLVSMERSENESAATEEGITAAEEEALQNIMAVEIDEDTEELLVEPAAATDCYPEASASEAPDPESRAPETPSPEARAVEPGAPEPRARVADWAQHVAAKEAGNAAASAALTEASITAAMGNGLMTLVYHPVLDTTDMEPEFYEIELSMQDGKAGRYKAEQLLNAVARCSLGGTLDRWAIERAVKVIAQLHRKGQTLKFMLNLSAQSIADSAFADWFARLLESARVDTAALIINLLQPDVLAQPQQASALVTHLHKLGLRVCVRQGSTSLPLTELPKACQFDYVRLADETSRKTASDKEYLDGVREAIATLHAAKARVIATHVNEFESLARLWEIDVDLVQGEYFQKFPKELSVESLAVQFELLQNAG